MKKLNTTYNDISYKNIVSAFRNNIEPNEEDIKELIKVDPMHSRTVALQAIAYNKKIPKKIIKSMRRKGYRISGTNYNCTIEFKIFCNIIKRFYTNKLVDILKRNPELLEFFI